SARSATATPTARSSAATPSSCPKSRRSTWSTRSISTRVELLAAAQDAGELAVHQDAGEVRLGPGVVALVIAEDLADPTVDLYRGVPRGGRWGCPFFSKTSRERRGVQRSAGAATACASAWTTMTAIRG